MQFVVCARARARRRDALLLLLLTPLRTTAPAAPGSPNHHLPPLSTQSQVCEEAVELLRSIRTPVGVIAVAGRARTGKSFILNQLLGRSAGFRLAHTHRPCTKGIWIWSRPVRRVGPDKEPYHLLLLDSEGIDAYNQTAQDGVQLLSMAVLLSSTFVFNQMGPIDEAAIDRLGLVAEVAKRVRVRATEGGGGPDGVAELGAFAPAFLWLLRDFYFSMDDGGRQVRACLKVFESVFFVRMVAAARMT